MFFIKYIRNWFVNRKKRIEQEKENFQWKRLCYLAERHRRDELSGIVCDENDCEYPISWGDQ